MENIELTLFNTAVEFIKQRYPKGWGGAAVAHTDDNRYLISVAPESFNASAELCIETGVICEAAKYNCKITHCICVVRDNENSDFKILTPCGICQERLRVYGDNVLVGVTSKDNSIKFAALKELMPYYWYSAYKEKNDV